MNEVMRVVHILGVVLWFGALMQVTRLLKTHSRSPEETHETLSKVERRTQLFVGLPGLILVLVSGLHLLGASAWIHMKLGWFHAKLTLVLVAIGIDVATFFTIRTWKTEARGILRPLLLHIFAGLLLIAILVMVKVRPF